MSLQKNIEFNIESNKRVYQKLYDKSFVAINSNSVEKSAKIFADFALKNKE